MILRFGCENFRSIGEYQEVLFTSSSKKDEDTYLFSPTGVREKVLPIISLYGANGSGKTNLLLGLRFCVTGIILSANRDFEYANIQNFRLDSEFNENPTSFDIDFIFNETHYHYGFSVKDHTVVTEWLYSFSYGSRMSRSVLFYRDITDGEPEFYFGKGLKGKNKSISEITGDSSLFLSVAAKAKHELLGGISQYFKENYNFRFKSEFSESSIGKKINKYGLEHEISNFLSLIDVGASRLEVTKSEIDDEQRKFRDSFQTALLNSFSDKDVNFQFPSDDHEFLINIHRRNSDDKELLFQFQEESLGTRALVSLLASVFWILKHGGVFVVDELESSLHTLLSLKVVELFNNQETNPNCAQLVFTTHETQLLNFHGVRRDEVWLTEKCRDGSTKVAPLSEYSISKRSNLRNGYLDGRFGAVPFLGLIDNFNLFETENASKEV
ncbi:AAA family ATPase [Endozoicomonas sp. 2B-B]